MCGRFAPALLYVSRFIGLKWNPVMTYLSLSLKARRYTMQGLLGLATLGLVATVVITAADRSAPALASVADEQAEPLDLLLYSNATLLRRRASLQDKDLAALDLTQAQAEAVLGRLVS